MDITQKLNQAIIAAKAGRKEEARRLLEAVLDADERSEQAWLWLGGVVDSEEDRAICLENVLTINPQNEIARQGLATLRAGADSSEAMPPPVGAGDDAPADSAAATDNRILILITIVLVLMLVFTLASIIIYTKVSPFG